MDPAHNPFAPGAGTRPPEFAGREAVIEAATVALRRVKAGRPTRSQMLLGLRGVGKTVLLNRVNEIAESEGFFTEMLEAQENRRLTDMLVPAVRRLLFQLSGVERARDRANRALAILQAFAGAFKVKAGAIEIVVQPPKGLADSGYLESDLPQLFLVVGEAARAAQRPVLICVDEVQYLDAEDLAALIVSVHKVGQKNLPLIVFGAGLPQLAALAGEAKSYAERLFDYPTVGPLDRAAAARAIREPIHIEGADIQDSALNLILSRAEGYPYFLQEWGSHAWNAATQSPITEADVTTASGQALQALDTGFFRVRMDRLTPREKGYVRAMAHLGAGPHRSGDIADALGMSVTTAGPLRSGLIRKGMIYSPAHGDTAFTVPMFDEFMRRTIPDWKPPIAKRRAKKK